MYFLNEYFGNRIKIVNFHLEKWTKILFVSTPKGKFLFEVTGR